MRVDWTRALVVEIEKDLFMFETNSGAGRSRSCGGLDIMGKRRI